MAPKRSNLPVFSSSRTTRPNVRSLNTARNLNRYPLRQGLGPQARITQQTSSSRDPLRSSIDNGASTVPAGRAAISTAAATRSSSTVQPPDQLATNSNSSAENQNSTATARTPINSDTGRSQYVAAQLAEPCVGNALSHILQPCGHKVMTARPEACSKNCKTTRSYFTNPRTKEVFACPICIPKIVRAHYVHKRSHFNLSFAEVDEVLGSAGQHWREQRAESMETVWQQEADAELAALKGLGRACRPIDVLYDGAACVAPPPGTTVARGAFSAAGIE